jgi:hypothetical protein
MIISFPGGTAGRYVPKQRQTAAAAVLLKRDRGGVRREGSGDGCRGIFQPEPGRPALAGGFVKSSKTFQLSGERIIFSSMPIFHENESNQ